MSERDCTFKGCGGLPALFLLWSLTLSLSLFAIRLQAQAPTVNAAPAGKPLVAKAAALPAAPQPVETALASLPVVLSGGSDHALKHWDAMGRLNGLIGMHETAVSALALTFYLDKEGKPLPLLVSGGAGGQLKIWNLAEDETANAMPLQSVKAHEGSLTTLAVAPNGRIIASGGMDASIRLWDRVTGQLLAEVQAHDEAVRSLQFSSDGKFLVSGSDDKQIRIWKVGEHGKMLDYESTIVAHDGAITALSISPDNTLIASVSTDGYLKIWGINGGALLRRIRVSSHAILTVAFSPDGKSVATGEEEGKIRVWNVKTGVGLPFAGSHERGVTALAWARNGEMLVSGGGDKTLRYWNAANGHQLARIAAHDGTVQAIVVMP